MRPNSPRELAAYLEHTMLRPEASAREIEKLCAEALQSGFRAVCVNGSRVAFARRCLTGTAVKIVAVVGFPLGAMTTRTKALETEGAVADGANEIDVVIALGQLRDGARDHVRRDLAQVVQAAGEARVKAILECGLLSDAEKTVACQLAVEAGVALVKTSTGFGPSGATIENVRLLRASVPDRIGVKAAGGIRDTRTALALIEAGASRIGTSSGVAILAGLLGPFPEAE